MKIKNIILIVALCGLGFSSCQNLDLKPKGEFFEAEFFSTETGVKSYFAGLYGWLPIEDFLYQQNSGYRPSNPWETWQSQKQTQGAMSGEFVGGPGWNNDGSSYWRYDRIRDVNAFINNFPNYKASYTESKFNELLGEARFLRAFIYFGMVKRYGGVPIVTEVQDPAGNIDSLQVKRDTEYDCYKFMYEDLKFACQYMTDKADKYRGTKWTALALQSRVMLYAATIAKYTEYVNYGQEQAYVEKYAGIDSDKANEFFQYSYEASKELIEKGPYELYMVKKDNLAENFHDMLLDIGSKETIFFKNYIHHDTFNRDAYLIGHNWDALMLPNPSMSNFVGSQAYPSLTVMRMFEGMSSLVEVVDGDSVPKRWTNPGDIREGMEPRLRGSIFFNGDTYPVSGATFDIRRGLYKTFTWKIGDMKDGLSNEPQNADDNRQWGNYDYTNASNRFYLRDLALTEEQITNIKNITVRGTGNNRYIYKLGEHGMKDNFGAENNCLTGAYIKKYIDFSRAPGGIVEHSSFQPWIAFRLGEVYLNHAEAAYELGLKEEANKYIRAIRERAGCKNLDIPSDPASVKQWDYEKVTAMIPIVDVGLQFIRDERFRELWGENHHWWDVKRWRVADLVMEQYRQRILSCYYVIDEDKYIYLDERTRDDKTWTANRNCYYQGIPSGEINKNPNLLPRNPFR